MSFQDPPTLLELLRQRLLKDESLAISGLQDLPRELFPTLFMEAFTGRQFKILKAMVAFWPFPCLPVGALMKNPHLETLQAVLDGLDMLFTQKGHPRKWKLQVVDLRNVHHNFWNMWAGKKDGRCSPQVLNKKQIGKDLPRYALRRHLKVVVDFSYWFHLDAYQTYILQWAEQRKNSLQLCCKKMEICTLPICTIRKILKILQAEYIEKLELNLGWSVSTLACFSPHLGQMRNIHTLSLARIYKNTLKMDHTFTDSEEKCINKFILQFSKLNCLQHLHMSDIYFLADHMKQLLRYLKVPLETLSISHCQLTQLDVSSLSQCQSLSLLKHLTLRGVELSDLCLMNLRVLLESVANTLQILELDHCKMEDSQLTVLLPAISQCSQLTKVNFYENDISMAVLKDLLYHTASLSQLTLELYPAPLECYNDMGGFLPERFSQLCPELMDTLRSIRKPVVVSFATDICLDCFERSVYNLQTRLCLCWQ
ncbi:PRAME family member 8-like [Nannospalax galili]|uniref:PRAME family member 8-like n=1 Tax=Nannospalax galili TaxID=1026970 RepID=A0A8C6QYJ3_NANGA|nr:PRAME family member 8-like [Nannospalax galili]